MSCRVFDYETLISFNTLEDSRLLYSPLADISPFFSGLGIFLLGVRRRPAGGPVVCELFEEVGFDLRRLLGLSVHVPMVG
jgi:hypothetical protein